MTSIYNNKDEFHRHYSQQRKSDMYIWCNSIYIMFKTGKTNQW